MMLLQCLQAESALYWFSWRHTGCLGIGIGYSSIRAHRTAWSKHCADTNDLLRRIVFRLHCNYDLCQDSSQRFWSKRILFKVLAEPKHVSILLRRSGSPPSSEAPRLVELNDRCHNRNPLVWSHSRRRTSNCSRLPFPAALTTH